MSLWILRITLAAGIFMAGVVSDTYLSNEALKYCLSAAEEQKYVLYEVAVRLDQTEQIVNSCMELATKQQTELDSCERQLLICAEKT